MKLKDLMPDRKNANKGTERGSQMIENSLRQYGAGRSILIDKNGRIIAGNKTAENAGAIGLEDVIVVQSDGTKLVAVQRTDLDLETDKAAKELAVADNRAGQVSLEWDGGVLQDLDIDLSKFWTEDELKAVFAEVVAPAELLTDEDAVPEVPAEPKTKLGDLYILGDHRLLCGDSTSITDVERLLDGETADVLFTDPPYNIDFKPQRGTHDKILNDNLNDADFSDFLDAVFACALASLKPDTYAFVWTGWSKLGAFERSISKFFKIQAFHVWVKNNFGIGYYSRPKHEPFYLCLNGKPVYPLVAPADVWEYAKVRDTVHSCEKPVGLIVEIFDTYHKNSVVLDLFGGSGSTLIACEKTGRKARLMELDPKYCDVIVTRWENVTGKKALRHHGN